MFGQPRSDTFNVVVTVMPPERIVTRSKKRYAGGELRLLTNMAGEFNEHVFHYHPPHEMQWTRLHIVYVSTLAACQFFERHGFAHIDREQAASMFASRTRVYPVINVFALPDGVEFDVDDSRPWQPDGGAQCDDAHVHQADLFDEADGGDIDQENHILPGVGMQEFSKEHDSDDTETDEMSENYVDFDESAIDVVDGDMTWHKFMSFTHAISAWFATTVLAELIM